MTNYTHVRNTPDIISYHMHHFLGPVNIGSKDAQKRCTSFNFKLWKKNPDRSRS